METVIETVDGVVLSGRRVIRACKRLGLNCPRTIVHCDHQEAIRLRSQMLCKSISYKRLLLWLSTRCKVHVATDGQANTVKKHLKELGATAPQREMLPHHLARLIRDVRRTRTPSEPDLEQFQPRTELPCRS